MRNRICTALLYPGLSKCPVASVTCWSSGGTGTYGAVERTRTSTGCPASTSS